MDKNIELYAFEATVTVHNVTWKFRAPEGTEQVTVQAIDGIGTGMHEYLTTRDNAANTLRELLNDL